MDATYLVWYSYLGLPTDGAEGLISKRVESRVFAEVEDWALANVPAGYELRTIEKHYGTPTELAMYGEVDLVLEGGRA